MQGVEQKKKEAKTQWLLNFRELRHLHFFPFSPFQSYFVCNLDILEGDSEMPYTGVQKYAIKYVIYALKSML